MGETTENTENIADGVSRYGKVESDMRVYPVKWFENEALTAQTFLEAIVCACPVIGLAVISEDNFKKIEGMAREYIRKSLIGRRNIPAGHLAVFITVVQYAKTGEQTKEHGFWAYICERFGFKYSETLRDILMNSVKEACIRYRRVFITDDDGSGNPYATVMAHAVTPKESFFALCDFLEGFYANNLNGRVVTGDPSIEHMTEVLRGRCLGLPAGRDEDVRGSVSGIKTGFRSLLKHRPVYMRHFLTRILTAMDDLFTGKELSDSGNYVKVLLKQWYDEKTVKRPEENDVPKNMRAAKKRIVSIKNMRVRMVLDDNREPAVKIPAFRLPVRRMPDVVIYVGGKELYRQRLWRIGVNPAENIRFAKEEIIPLSELVADVTDAELDNIRAELFKSLRVEIRIADKREFVSDKNLLSRPLLFKNGRPVKEKTVKEDSYILLAPYSSAVRFKGDVDSQRLYYPCGALYNLYIKSGASVFVDDMPICRCEPPFFGQTIRRSDDFIPSATDTPCLGLPYSDACYIAPDGLSYPVYSRDELSITAYGVPPKVKLKAKTANGYHLRVSKNGKDGENTRRIEPPQDDGTHIITISDGVNDAVLHEERIYIAERFGVEFNKPYYFENADDGKLTLTIDGETYETELSGCGQKITFPHKGGKILISVPVISVTLDGRVPSESYNWRDIRPASKLRVVCPDSLTRVLTVGGHIVAEKRAPGGFEYAVGNAVAAYDGDATELGVNLVINKVKHPLFDIIREPRAVKPNERD